VGKILEEEIVRAVMALRVKDFAGGHSGIRLSPTEFLIELLNRGVYPVIPEKGSVGASGDLAPLAHLGLVLIGLGEAFYQGRRMSGSELLSQLNLKPLELEGGEGLLSQDIEKAVSLMRSGVIIHEVEQAVGPLK